MRKNYRRQRGCGIHPPLVYPICSFPCCLCTCWCDWHGLLQCMWPWRLTLDIQAVTADDSLAEHTLVSSINGEKAAYATIKVVTLLLRLAATLAHLVFTNCALHRPIITLRPGGFIKWNQRTNHGYWYYVWTEEAGGYFFIEFAANDRNHQQKRHIFKQVEEDQCILLPPTDLAYTNHNDWQNTKSLPHVNKAIITMQKILPVPRLE